MQELPSNKIKVSGAEENCRQETMADGGTDMKLTKTFIAHLKRKEQISLYIPYTWNYFHFCPTANC